MSDTLRQDITLVMTGITHEATRRGWNHYFPQFREYVEDSGWNGGALTLPRLPRTVTYAYPVTGYVRVTVESDDGAPTDEQVESAWHTVRYSGEPEWHGRPARSDDGRVPALVADTVDTLPTDDQWEAWANGVDWTAHNPSSVRQAVACALLALADEHDWCSEYDDAVAALNSALSEPFLLPRDREREFYVTLTETREFRVTVMASDEDEARERAESDYSSLDYYPTVVDTSVDDVEES